MRAAWSQLGAALTLALYTLGVAPLAWGGPGFVPIEVIEIPEAMGPPEAPSCADALAHADALKDRRGPLPPDPPPIEVAAPPEPASPVAPAPPAARPAGDRPEPAVVQDAVVRIEDVRAGRVPGGEPGALPLQPLEGSAAALKAVGDVIRLAEAGQPVRLSFFGASHVGGDYFTGELRRRLQTRYGDRGHGFTWPAALYAYHRAHDVNLCRTDGWRSDWVGREGGRHDGRNGFAGASVSSSDPFDLGWIETTRDNAQGRAIGSLDLFLLGQPGGGSLLITVDGTAPRVVGTHRDDVEMLHIRVKVPDGPHRFQIQPLGDGEVRVLGTSAERAVPGVIVDSMGIRGRTARTWLARDRDLVVQGVRALAPDLLVLAYGTNEAADTDYRMDRYRDDLRAVIALARGAAPGVACVLVGPSDRATEQSKGRRWAVWGRTALVAQVQREVAQETGCVFWDWQQATGGPGSMITWRLHDPPLAGWDLIHFSQRGYEVSAQRFHDALLDAAHRSGGLRF